MGRIDMNRLFKDKLSGVFSMLLLSALFVGCIHDDVNECPDIPNGGSMTKSYITLSFDTPGQKGLRADNPTGGEDGDGRELGTDAENIVTKAAAFLFQGNNGVNSANPHLIPVTVVEFDNVVATNDNTRYETESKSVKISNGTYNVLVVANPGDLNWAHKAGLSLKDLQDRVETTAWLGDGTTFLMSSKGDVSIILENNPEEDPATAEVDVERVAARVDYKAEATYTCDKGSQYDGTVEVLGAYILNNYNAGSYLLKRVTNSATDWTKIYLGKEQTDASYNPTNYVVDPYTEQKTAVETNWPELYMAGSYFNTRSEDPNYWDEVVKAGTAVGTEGWLRAGYTMENTVNKAYTSNTYNTGVAFKARFTPTSVIGATSYTKGTTFFAYGTRLFASMEDVMNLMYGESFGKFDAVIDACKDWEDVRRFANTLIDNDPSGYKQYLLMKTEVAGVFDANALKWAEYMLAECGYSKAADGTVTLDLQGKVTRIALMPFNVRTYENGICYYVWWIRHANDGNDNTNGVMEYATVRNNIYKIYVNSIYGLGTEVPDDSDDLSIDVYVNDWLLLDEETLPM